jgi:NADPH-dependent 2,4-dienoyl-CoA reductase/sulfur reductase-like enzyme
MSWQLDRRAVLSGLGLSAAAALIPSAFARTTAKVIIIGGGFGGATAASKLKAIAPEADVTLIETNRAYHSCPMSNLVIAGHKQASGQTFRYEALEQLGINVVNGWATDVDPVARTVTVGDNQILQYDRLILSPGIDMRWGAIEGYNKGDAVRFPHAWKGRMQRQLLAKQLNALEDGQTVLMSVPPAPYRCPPGPYERASLIAHYLKTQKPKSKLIILDSKDSFSKMPLFKEAWATHYPDHLEWISASNDGRVSSVDPAAMTLSTDFETYKASVANVIPPQKAGQIADHAGVTDATGWCPINATTFESTLQPNIHVIGDATIAAPMPKSAFSANLQGKLCAMAVSELLAGRAPQPTVLANTCYSYTTPNQAVSIVGAYTNQDGKFESIPGAGGLSPMQAPDAIRETEAAEAEGWFKAITKETFG